MPNPPSFLKKVIWAVDVFDSNRKFHKAAAQVLKGLSFTTGASIEVVHILDLNEVELSHRTDGPWEEFYRRAAQSALERLMSELQLNTFVNSNSMHVILQRTSSAGSDGVKSLIRYAEQRNADLLVVSTHGRSGLRRVLLGSFAEKLLLTSSVPIMTLAPEAIHLNSSPFAFDEVFFPADFEQGSKDCFRAAVRVAKELGAKKITLFHSVPHPVEPIIQSGVNLLGGAWFSLVNHYGYKVEQQTRRGQTWANWAQNQGLKAESIIWTEGGSIADSIQSLTQNRPGTLILMVEKAGPITSTLMGSITRQVVRHSSCPVWVLRPSMISKVHKEIEPFQKAA